MHTLYTFSMHQSIRLPVTIHGANIRQSVPYPAGSPRFGPVPYPIQEKYAPEQTITIEYFALLFRMHCAYKLAATQSEGKYRPFSG